MTSITTLKDQLNTSTTHLALLSIATAGIFPVMWLYRHVRDIEDVTQAKISSDTFLIWLAACTGIGLALRTVGSDNDTLEAITGVGSLLQLAAGVLWCVWGFRARKALQDYALHQHRIELRMNAFYTLIFHVFYVNYCVNDLPEAARKKAILSSPTDIARTEN